jgi:hypothetical protein
MRLELEKEEIAVDARSLRSKFREGIGSDALSRIRWRAREYVYAADTFGTQRRHKIRIRSRQLVC